jgi:hypothetical protein
LHAAAANLTTSVKEVPAPMVIQESHHACQIAAKVSPFQPENKVLIRTSEMVVFSYHDYDHFNDEPNMIVEVLVEGKYACEGK